MSVSGDGETCAGWAAVDCQVRPWSCEAYTRVGTDEAEESVLGPLTTYSVPSGATATRGSELAPAPGSDTGPLKRRSSPPARAAPTDGTTQATAIAPISPPRSLRRRSTSGAYG